MPLTAEQQAKIKDILLKYRRDVRQVVRQHRELVTTAVENHDKQQTEAILRKLQSA